MSITNMSPFPGLAWGPYPQRISEITVSSGRRKFDRFCRRIASRGALVAEGFSAGARAAIARNIIVGAAELERLSDKQLFKNISAYKQELAVNGLTQTNVDRGLTLMSDLCRRTLGQTPYFTQIAACRILLSNRLAEMATGEGKTLACGISAAIAAMAGIPVHVLTANDYLVQRDLSMMKPLFDTLGLSSACILQGQQSDTRQQNYRCDVVFSTAKELVFDYLRDRITLEMNDAETDWQIDELSGQASDKLLMRGLCMAIVDEADSILLDEACTPLILSRQLDQKIQDELFKTLFAHTKQMWVGRDFVLKAEYKKALLTEAGRQKLSQLVAAQAESTTQHPRELVSLAQAALAAIHLFHRDRDYLVANDSIEQIDVNSGRVATGRVWSGGLQQMIEIKEGLQLTPSTETIAQITYQQFFVRYLRLCGLSGTLAEAQGELAAVYALTIENVPLRTASRRKSRSNRIFTSSEEKWDAVVQTTQDAHRTGRPVLIGTDSVEQSKLISTHLTKRKLRHQLLDAANHQTEAEVIANAGQPGAITVATNMAGRGTDIALNKSVCDLGGLLLIACHFNDERRTDRQLFGRTARQGQPGEVVRIASLDTSLPAAVRMPLNKLLNLSSNRIFKYFATAIAHACLQIRQLSTESRQRRIRIQLLEAGIARDRIFASSGIGE
ncbi:MAG: DEAD/DEAH box helicase [Burkholderiaceae bacterium]